MNRSVIGRPAASAAALLPRRAPPPPWTRPALLSALLGATLLSATLLAGAQGAVRASDASVTFAYRVTLIPVTGSVNALSSSGTLDFADLQATRATVRVDLGSLKTGIALRDEHAREALGAAEHPTATFTLNRFDGPTRVAAGQTVTGDASGSFTLNGVTRPLRAPVTLTRSGERLNVRSAFTLRPQEYGVNVRGADQTTSVTVNFTLGAP